jgi:uncharacterized protein (TIGR03118 family)
MERKTLFFVLVLGTAVACKKNNNNNGYGTPAPPAAGNYQQTNLVADIDGFTGARIDATLKNPWGLAINPTAQLVWLGTNHSGASNVYDYNGQTGLPPVPIPLGGDMNGSSPTGVAFSAGDDFIIPTAQASARFIFVSEDGTVSAWSPGDATAVTVADRSGSNAVYKGCAIATDGGHAFLYAANFKGGTIDVFDKNFALAAGRAFTDPTIPAGFGPFNIVNINGLLYVAYAKLKGPDNEDDEAGAGNGYVDIYNPDGTLVKNFTSKGPLNSPWGIARVPNSFGLPFHSIVIGNFGDGWINAYDSTGVYLGALQSNGTPIAINGLWALDFPVNEDPRADPNKLFFTAGPADEQHGLFGYLKNQQ